MAKDNDEKNSDAYIYIIGAVLGVIVFIVWICAPSLVSYFLIGEASEKHVVNYEMRGQFGDLFGSVNALFSGLAFVGLIIAILLQKNELELQRQELSETREEFKDQNKTMKKQRFENTFFNLLSLHNEIVSSASIDRGNNMYFTSRQVYEVIFNNFKMNYARNSTDTSLDKTRAVFNDFYNRHEAILGHYYRNLYRIYDFISHSDIDDKIFYAKIVRAQLSNKEMVLLFYAAYFLDSGKGFQEHVSKYNVFDNLRPADLVHNDDITVMD